MARIDLRWDDALSGNVGNSICTVPDADPCPAEGYLRHRGKKFSPFANPGKVGNGYPLTATGNVVGLSGGFGWSINFNKAPRNLYFEGIEVDAASKLIVSIPYPKGTQFIIQAQASNCWNDTKTGYDCEEIFTPTSSIESVRNGKGNTYHVDANGVLTLRIAQTGSQYTGNPTWSLPTYSTPPRFAEQTQFALNRFERNGVRIPERNNNFYVIYAKCPSDSTFLYNQGYCPESVPIYDPDVCASGFTQVSYDRCCQTSDLKKCVFADGSKNF